MEWSSIPRRALSIPARLSAHRTRRGAAPTRFLRIQASLVWRNARLESVQTEDAARSFLTRFVTYP